MIPKIIHYTWFSGEPFPEKIQKCIDSWRRYMPNYEFVLWDMNRIKDIQAPFLREALFEKKWAFAADYVRLFAIANYGGIYLDTDVEVYKPFDPLLVNECFIGRENSWHFFNDQLTVCYLSSHCFGAIKGHEFIKRTLAYYDGIHFEKTSVYDVPNILRMDMTIIPYVQAVFALDYGYNWNLTANYTQELSKGITVYPSNVFDRYTDNEDSYCKHFAIGNWRESELQTEKITLQYKIKWRLVAILKFLLNKFGYIAVKIY